MRDLIDPAIASLARQIKGDEFNAVRYVLDWAGFKATEKLQTDSEIVITVRREEQPIVLEHNTPYQVLNGSGHTDD